MKFGLKDQTIAAIQGVFAKHPEIERAIVYGSRAKGNFKPGSDIDLTFEGADLNIETIYRIDEELDDLMLPYKFDLSILRQIENPALVEHIRRVGQEIYKRPKT